MCVCNYIIVILLPHRILYHKVSLIVIKNYIDLFKISNCIIIYAIEIARYAIEIANQYEYKLIYNKQLAIIVIICVYNGLTQ